MHLLVIRFSSAGDIVLTSQFLRCLRARWPDAVIHYLTKEEFAPLVEHAPQIGRLWRLPRGGGLGALRAMKREMRAAVGGRFDVVFDLHGSLRSRIMRFALGRALGVVAKPTLAKWLLVRLKINRLTPIVPIPDRYRACAERFGVRDDGLGLELHLGPTHSPLDGLTDRRTIALAPGARHHTKQWPAERFAELGRRYATAGARVVLLGAPNERELCEEIAKKIGGDVVNLAGRTGYLEAAAALDACDVIVTNDSALAHIAAARLRPVVAIFGSTVREFGFAPWRTRAVVVENAGLDCRPCTTIGRAECPKGHFRCMVEIDVTAVANAGEGIMNAEL